MEDFKNGNIVFVRNGMPPRYDSVLEVVLKSNNIKYSFDLFGHLYPDCYAPTMDSLLKTRFGDHFIDKSEQLADSLFLQHRKNGTFNYYEVDTWAFRKNDNRHLGGDYIINFLNEKIPKNASFKFVSNTVARPFYVIEFTVDQGGNTKNIEVKERVAIDRYPGTEELIIQEVAKITDWIPAKINSEHVTARFEIGIAIEDQH